MSYIISNKPIPKWPQEKPEECPVAIFALDRLEDETGVSGAGRVAYGAVFPNGKTVLAWTVEGKPQSIGVYESVHDMFAIHVGFHKGKTLLTWLYLPEEIQSWADGRL